MKYLVFTLLFSIGSLQLSACSCRFTPIGIKYIMFSKTMVKGVIVEKKYINLYQGGVEEEFEDAEGAMMIKYKLDIKDKIKGFENEDEIYFYSYIQSSACGVNFNKGDEFYLFLYFREDYGKWFTDSCVRNMSVNTGKENEHVKNLIFQYKNSNKRNVWKNEMGEIEAKGKLLERKQEGKWKYYYRNGMIKAKGKYKNGKLEGKWKEYVEPEMKDRYSDPEPKKQKKKLERIVFYEDGKQIEEKTIIKNKG